METLLGDLGQLEGEVSQRLKAAVHDHYAQFVRATPGGGGLDLVWHAQAG